ncbi:MAG: hypothetical protein WC700_19015 [Gemmatimonadaceae bacterium]|jgi:hypothetical protein
MNDDNGKVLEFTKADAPKSLLTTRNDVERDPIRPSAITDAIMPATPPADAPITFTLATGEEILAFHHDAFYARGVRIEGGPGEAAHVHRTFMEWFTTGVMPQPKLVPWDTVRPGERVLMTVDGSYEDEAGTITFAEGDGALNVDRASLAEVMR